MVSIYKITFQSKNNNTYYYIGKSKDVDKRFNDHLYDIISKIVENKK